MQDDDELEAEAAGRKKLKLWYTRGGSLVLTTDKSLIWLAWVYDGGWSGGRLARGPLVVDWLVFSVEFSWKVGGRFFLESTDDLFLQVFLFWDGSQGFDSCMMMISELWNLSRVQGAWLETISRLMRALGNFGIPNIEGRGKKKVEDVAMRYMYISISIRVCFSTFSLLHYQFSIRH